MQKIKSVLLVDDDPASNYLAQLLFKRLAMVEHLSVAANGKEALDYVMEHLEQSSFPELILLDINMPLMDGFEFIEQFQRLPFYSRSRVVLLSSSVSFKDKEKAAHFQLAEFINKPLTREKLAKIIQN
ncbi:response regulator [Pontibacter sp. E15-1]|uniref:response regulator n=1 Tax=Pontibacter sp. E15-1 TaxID=2919918 RepID=UPI001F4F11FF|nr:response regulator [Pontibacter sp. E15-1]MCJ8164195.1 response regulator [Pontibacter sp. E15-1]